MHSYTRNGNGYCTCVTKQLTVVAFGQLKSLKHPVRGPAVGWLHTHADRS